MRPFFPGLIRRIRHQRTVLEALAEVGPAGMTPNSLEVTTELAEPELKATLQELMAAGLVCRQAKRETDFEDEDGGGALTDRHDRRYLLAEHAGRRS